MPLGSEQYFTQPKCGRNAAAHQNQLSLSIRMEMTARYKSRLNVPTSLVRSHNWGLSIGMWVGMIWENSWSEFLKKAEVPLPQFLSPVPRDGTVPS